MMGCLRLRGFTSSTLLLLSLLCPALGHAFGYPTKAVMIIAPFPAGGAADQQARLIATGLTERLGKPVIVENHAGAGGEIGASIAARSADFTRYMAEQGGFVITSGPDQVSQRIQSDYASLSRLIKAVNLKVDE